MTQNINLYQPSLTAQGLLSAKVMLSVCGALALVFTILASHAFWNMWIREREVAALEVQKEDLGRVVSDLKERVSRRSEDPTLAARERNCASAGSLISTKCVPSIGSRGRRPGATSSRRCDWATSEHTSGQVLKRSGSTSRAPAHMMS